MERLSYKILINAPREKVWEKLWNEQTYPEWTSPFGEGSEAFSEDWEEGSRVIFTAGDGHGMYSEIVKKIANEYISFRHLGMYKDGKELPVDEEAKQWSGSMETFTLRDSGGKTELLVEVDTDKKDTESLNKAFPEALQKLKSLSES